MLSEKFQRKIFEAHKGNHDAVIPHGKYEYAIAYNAVATVHTWVIRRQINGDGKWHWLQPLSEEIGFTGRIE